MRRNIILTLMAVLLLCCTACKKEKPNVRQTIKAAELSTVEYTVRQIFKFDDPKKKMWGERKILGYVKGTLEAGIKLNKVEDKDIVENEGKIKLTLPTPEILSLSVPDSTVHYVYERIGALRGDFTINEKNEIIGSCEDSILNNTQLISSIIEDAKIYATDFFEVTLTSLGYTDIEIVFEDRPSSGPGRLNHEKKRN